MWQYKIFIITKDFYKEDPGLSSDERKVLATHIGYYVAAEKTERGWRILVKSMANRRELAARLAEKLLLEGY